MDNEIPVGIKKSIFNKCYELLNRHRVEYYYFRDFEIIEKRKSWEDSILQRQINLEEKELQAKKLKEKEIQDKIDDELREKQYKKERLTDLYNKVTAFFKHSYINMYLILYDSENRIDYVNNQVIIERKYNFSEVEQEMIARFLVQYEYEVINNKIKIKRIKG